MKITHQSVLAASALAIGALLDASALVALADSTWTPAPNAPSNCPPTTPGCNAPINVGAATQSKSGLLGLGNVVIDSLRILTSEGTTTSTQGQVLTAINNNGDVEWRAVTTGTGGSSNSVTLGTVRASSWWNASMGTNYGTTSCPTNYYMSGVVQGNGCSGGYCGLNIICNHF